MAQTLFGYAYDPALSYEDHLRIRDSMGGAATQVSKSVKKGSDNVRSDIDQMSDRLSEDINRGMDRLGSGLDEISDALHEINSSLDSINSTMEWGFSSILVELKGMQTTLTDLEPIRILN